MCTMMIVMMIMVIVMLVMISGLIGELVTARADLIVAPLTINPERAQVVWWS